MRVIIEHETDTEVKTLSDITMEQSGQINIPSNLMVRTIELQNPYILRVIVKSNAGKKVYSRVDRADITLWS